jgi:hypothetical protein
MFHLTIKEDEHGGVDEFKARLVIKGCQQVQGRDVGETFSPTPQAKSFRVIMAKAAQEDLNLRQLDVSAAFLNGKLQEEVYMKQPEGFDDGTGRVLRLRKSLYGLRQAPRCWYTDLVETLKELKVKQCQADPCVCILRRGTEFVIIWFHVDDFVIASNSKALEQEVVDKLKEHYNIKDKGEPTWILGMRVQRDRAAGTITIDQEMYVRKVLERFGMQGCSTVSTPAQEGVRLTAQSSPTCEDEKREMMKHPFREMAGSVLYAAICTRPDILQAVNAVCKFMGNPGKDHLIALKRILRYLSGTASLGIKYKRVSKPTIWGFSDADWASDPDKRRSTTGYLFGVAGGPVAWHSRLQPTVALSSVEAEYMAQTFAAQEAAWLKKFLRELGSEQGAVEIKVDNQGAKALAENDVQSARTKHIDVKYHYVRTALEAKDIILTWIPSKDQVADIFTKPLGKGLFQEHRKALQVE